MICSDCNQEMLTANGCTIEFFEIDSKIYQRIPVSITDHEGRCPDCGAKLGHYHHYGCDQEVCPKCNIQLFTCYCKQ